MYFVNIIIKLYKLLNNNYLKTINKKKEIILLIIKSKFHILEISANSNNYIKFY